MNPAKLAFESTPASRYDFTSVKEFEEIASKKSDAEEVAEELAMVLYS
jgi:hypothetical protein